MTAGTGSGGGGDQDRGRAPPIETSEGWLLFYHGVQTTCNGYVYSYGAVLLDLEQPEKVLYRTRNYLHHPGEGLRDERLRAERRRSRAPRSTTLRLAASRSTTAQPTRTLAVAYGTHPRDHRAHQGGLRPGAGRRGVVPGLEAPGG